MTEAVSSFPSNRWQHHPREEVLRLLDVHLKSGLSGIEAQHRLGKTGPNRLRAIRSTPA